MTVVLSSGVIVLEGSCPVEDAERLLALLDEGARIVDLSSCTYAHTAVVQLLLAARVTLNGADPKGFLGEWILPGRQKREAG